MAAGIAAFLKETGSVIESGDARAAAAAKVSLIAGKMQIGICFRSFLPSFAYIASSKDPPRRM
ncbi:hypothetical protein [Loktanella salsilacus]|uniref:hypothetical protein n=1 Tax=Loktanella salsilacus TaxID=195913 RepID=UPI0030FC4E99